MKEREIERERERERKREIERVKKNEGPGRRHAIVIIILPRFVYKNGPRLPERNFGDKGALGHRKKE